MPVSAAPSAAPLCNPKVSAWRLPSPRLATACLQTKAAATPLHMPAATPRLSAETIYVSLALMDAPTTATMRFLSPNRSLRQHSAPPANQPNLLFPTASLPSLLLIPLLFLLPHGPLQLHRNSQLPFLLLLIPLPVPLLLFPPQ